MKKQFLIFSLAAVALAGKSHAQTQPCGTDEARMRLLAEHPELVEVEKNLEKQIKEGLKNINLRTAKRTTSGTDSANMWYDIPIVLHIIHDFNDYSASSKAGDYIIDDDVFNDLIDWNIVYAGANTDTADVITPFKKWVGIPRIRLHLAARDPLGNPTKGITRHRSYLTYVGGDQSKLDDWDPTSYVNIWTVNTMNAANGNAAAYAYRPPDAASIPFYDGVICLAGYLANDYNGAYAISKTINHEVGHVFNLIHPFGLTNNPPVAVCGDDEVDDTPPTKGHLLGGCTPAALYDTVCDQNYYKIYTDINGNDSLVNYPDTANSQNIMDYTYCSKMFTKGQVVRMHQALQSDVAGRNHLWDSTNLVNTGVMDGANNLVGRLDLKPIPDFNVTKNGSYYLDKMSFFVFPGATNTTFHNESWNDTLTNLKWTFINGSDSSVNTSLTSFTKTFHQPGWVKLTMTATGNNTGDSSRTWPQAVFVADSVGRNVSNYFMEFDGTGDDSKWPMFNYYNNEFKWTVNNSVGFYDNHCIQYTGFDTRLNPTSGIFPLTGTPSGDGDDMFSVPVDLSSFTDACNLNFFYSGASRSSSSVDINDSLIIDYSVNKSQTWTRLKVMNRGTLCNKGASSTAYVPTSQADWAPMTIALPPAARTAYTVFRFRYKPQIGASSQYSTGNNFYMDRVSFSRLPAEVSAVNMANTDVKVVPNPTAGDAWVMINSTVNTTAQIIVTDITGKMVYTVSNNIVAGQSRIEIPHTVIAAKGVYLVQTVTGKETNTQKLVVY